MNDAKYIGLDVHRATISAAVLDSAGNLVMEAILETKTEIILQFYARPARQFAGDLRRGKVGRLAARSAEAARHTSAGLRYAQDWPKVDHLSARPWDPRCRHRGVQSKNLPRC
jgi:hypothetical protein